MSDISSTIMDEMASGTEELKSAVIQKQREMNDLNEYRFKSLETLLKQKELESNTEKQKYKNLKEDFEYNLKLLEGRDEELKRYDVAFLNMKRLIAEKDEVVSDLRATISELELRIKQEQARSNDLEVYYQEKLQELKNEAESYRVQIKKEVDESFRAKESESDEYRSIIQEKRKEIEELRDKISDLKDEMTKSIDRENDMRQKLTNLQINRETLLEERRMELKTSQEKISSLKEEITMLKNSLANVGEREKELRREMSMTHMDYEKSLRASHATIAETENEFKRKITAIQLNYEKQIEEKRNENHILNTKISTLREELANLKEEVSKATERESMLKQKLQSNTHALSNHQPQYQQHHHMSLSDAYNHQHHHQHHNNMTSIRKTIEREVNQEFPLTSISPVPSFTEEKWGISETPRFSSQIPKSPQGAANNHLLRSGENHIALDAHHHSIQQQSFDTALVKQLNERIKELTHQIEHMSRDPYSSTNLEQITQLNSMLTDLREEHERQKEKMHRISKENKHLKIRLRDAARDLKKLMNERERLIDISNDLKSQLNKAIQESQSLQVRGRSYKFLN